MGVVPNDCLAERLVDHVRSGRPARRRRACLALTAFLALGYNNGTVLA